MLSICRISEGRGWATLTEIAEMTGVHETYVAAILRHLHKTRYGSYIVDKKHRENRRDTYEYRVRGSGTRFERAPIARSSSGGVTSECFAPGYTESVLVKIQRHSLRTTDRV